ncbi:MAG TPA: class F sortase [Patescibacteria group bacterium]|nr:class F sortase [Patescibacteria group bacterium]
MKPPFKFILITVFLGGLLWVAYSFLYLPLSGHNNLEKKLSGSGFGWKYPVAKFPSTGPGGNLAYSDIRDPGGIPRGLPVRLKIPVIGVDSTIEDALITKDGRMDVPAGSKNVAWFSLGPHPGQVGSAVIGGHFGIQNGVPFVFYNLDKLKSGDKIYIEDDSGHTLAFVVRSISSFDRNADATTVFTSGDGLAHLNLITCEGIWNQVNDTYPQRLVVFTDAIPGEGAVVVKKPPQVEAKLPTTAIKPTPTPVPTPTSAPSSALSQTLVLSAKSLFATPRDALVTSLLLASVVFVVFKIIRR